MNKQLNEEFIKKLSKKKKEPEWMLHFRLQSYQTFQKLENPSFGPHLDIDFKVQKIKLIMIGTT